MDNLTPEQRKKNMRNIRSKNTLPEIIVEKYFRKNKIYFSREYKNIFGKPDFVFRRKKILIFVDSDFWHCNPKRFKMPKSNIEYWEGKMTRNKERDKLVNRYLRKEGWKVFRYWESDIKKNVDKTLKKVSRLITSIK